MKINEDGTPMMSEKEIALIIGILVEMKPKHCLEWGSGNSTVYFPKALGDGASWLSVEHNGNYVVHLSDKIADNTTVIWVPDNEWYVDCVKHSRTFQFILIDGLHRERCLEIAKKIVSEDGIILLHDAGRTDYQGFIKKYGGEVLIDGEVSTGDGGYAHRGLARFMK